MKQIIIIIVFLNLSTLLFGQPIINVKVGDKSKMFLKNGSWYFKDKLPDGHYIAYLNNDTLKDQEIYFQNGLKNGMESRYSYFFDGKKKYLELNWKNGKLNGITTLYGGNGNFYCPETQINFVDNVADGQIINNTILCTKDYSGYFKKGIKDSIWKFYEFYDDYSRIDDSSNYFLERVYRYQNGVPFLISAWNRKGDQIVVNGNGVFIKDQTYVKIVTHYENGLKEGLEVSIKQNGDTINLKKYSKDIIIYERLKHEREITSDSTSYFVTKQGSFEVLNRAKSYLYSISEWELSDEMEIDTIREYFDFTNHPDFRYTYDIIRKPKAEKSGLWAIYFDNGVPAVEGKYLKGKRIGEWNWKYPNGVNRLKINYDSNYYQHFDSSGNVASNYKNEYLTAISEEVWSGDNFFKNLVRNKLILSTHYSFDNVYSLRFYLSGKVGFNNMGDSHDNIIGDYYLIGDKIVLNIKDENSNAFKRYRFKLFFDKKGNIKFKKVRSS
jgi:antitoxin component YwqK of YwqJK toxin-antitoxin module